MQYHTYDDGTGQYPVCILVPAIRTGEIRKEYIDPFDLDPMMVLTIVPAYKSNGKKLPIKEMREYLNTVLVPTFKDMGCQYIVVADSDYYKELTGQSSSVADLGYVRPSTYGDFNVVYVPNYRTVFYNPDDVRSKIAQGMNALREHAEGGYTNPGEDVIRFEEYPKTYDEIKAWLQKLLDMQCPLTVDIEAASLKAQTAGIGTISFAWNKHEGIAFAVDYVEIEGAIEAPFGKMVRNQELRDLLVWFFRENQQKMIYHNIAYDGGVLIYQLFMEHLIDTAGLLEGIEVILANWEDTKQITYLATNSCAGNDLSLKEQAQEFAGNYAEDEIKDILRIRLPQLLRYNLKDTCSTWFVHDKHMPTLIADNQLGVYEDLFKPATVDIIQMQLTGMPIDMKRVKVVKVELQKIQKDAWDRIQNNKHTQEAIYRAREKWVVDKNEKLKKKRVTLADAPDSPLNPNSPNQLQALLYDQLGLPVISQTKTKQPGTDADTLEKLGYHTKDPLVKDLLEALLDFAGVDKIVGTFIPAMEGAMLGPDGWHYLFGNFNLGGAVSGRLSSSEPNLQNLPAGSEYGKLIKSCFIAPEGWIFTGLDFASLEDKISALTTKDPNKIKVYTDGYDGHSLRAYTYWSRMMPDISNTLESINSLAEKKSPYYSLRNKSKAPTFALTYQGTHKTLMKNCGFSKEEALEVEAKYHELYVVSDQWVQAQLTVASKTGYIEAAFGLRIRTPLLRQVVRGTSKTPHEAEAEGRTAGNALGQSWCLLNSRAASEFMGKVRKSKFRYDIRPCAHIHDAQYYLMRDDLAALMYTNEHLVKAVEWQDHPAIAHPEVKLGGELSIFWPSWAEELSLPNGASESQILDMISSHHEGLSK